MSVNVFLFKLAMAPSKHIPRSCLLLLIFNMILYMHKYT